MIISSKILIQQTNLVIRTILHIKNIRKNHLEIHLDFQLKICESNLQNVVFRLIKYLIHDKCELFINVVYHKNCGITFH